LQTEDTSPSAANNKGQVFLQQAETVRLGQEGGGFWRVTDLVAQERIDDPTNDLQPKPLLLRIMTTGTHVGKTYSGKVEER
jgi:hypothetical protein